MKNVVSTIIVFGSIFILIVAGAFIFDKFNGFGLIDNMDNSFNQSIKHVLENENDNTTINNGTEKEKENASENKLPGDDVLDMNNNTDNNTDILDNESITKDNNSLDNNSL